MYRARHRCWLCGNQAFQLSGDRRCGDCRAALVFFTKLVRHLRKGPRPADLGERIEHYANKAAAGEPLFG
jgi:hypothetical protein